MKPLIIQIINTEIISGDNYPISISLQNLFDDSLYEIRLTLRTTSNIQIVGNSSLRVPQLAPNGTLLLEVPLRGKLTGTGEIRIERINARYHGRIIDFNDVQARLDILQYQVDNDEIITLTCNPSLLMHSSWNATSFNLHNCSPVILQSVTIQFHSNQIELDSESKCYSIEAVQPDQKIIFPGLIYPVSSGDLYLAATVRVTHNGEKRVIVKKLNFSSPAS